MIARRDNVKEMRIRCRPNDYVIKFPRSRGDSGALYLQSAPAEVISRLGYGLAGLPLISGVDVWVLRNRTS
jgi:hypothetical protein